MTNRPSAAEFTSDANIARGGAPSRTYKLQVEMSKVWDTGRIEDDPEGRYLRAKVQWSKVP